MSKKILILDGDSIAYRCAAAAEDRFVRVTHVPTQLTKNFKHRTEFKEIMKSKGKEITEDYLIEDDRTVEPLEYVLSTVKRHIQRIVDYVEPDEVKIFAGEQFNFRVELPLPSKYKGSRKDTIRPLHLKDAKQYLHNKYNAREAVGIEVDDLCAISAYDALRNGDKPVMYFYEKDQYQLDGITLLHDKSEFEYETVPVLGNLRLEKTAVKGLGLKFLAYQWICSDLVDCYCAYELSNAKFGAKTAYKVLNELKTEQEVLLAVIKQFKVFYPEPFEYKCWKGNLHQADWKSMLQLYFSCCRMKRSMDDKLDCRDLFNQYNINLEDFA